MTVNCQSVYPAVTTQCNDDLSINFEATQKMIDTIIKEGVDGFIALGIVGENASHTREEKVAILKAVKKIVAGRSSELTRAPRLPLSGEERTNVECIFNEASDNRIDLTKFNLD